MVIKQPRSAYRRKKDMYAKHKHVGSSIDKTSNSQAHTKELLKSTIVINKYSLCPVLLDASLAKKVHPVPDASFS